MMLVAVDLRAQPVVINEIQASNNTTIADEDGDFEDWIELYNTGADSVDLSGNGLSDDYNRPFRWIFPEGTVIPPGAYLLVWASGKNRHDPGQPMHTNFSIAQAGEEILLSHQIDGLIDEVPPIRIPSDYSYGRYPDGSESRHFFSSPSPGMPNIEPDFDGQVSDPVLSYPGGFFSAPFYLTAETDPHPGTSVHFTLDGSEPTEYDPVWPDSLLITHRQHGDHLLSYIQTNPPEFDSLAYRWIKPEEPPFLATVLRLRAFRDGDMPSRIKTHTYFITGENQSEVGQTSGSHADGASGAYSTSATSANSTTSSTSTASATSVTSIISQPQTTQSRYPLPVISLVTDSLSLFDHEYGIYIPGIYYENASGFNYPWGHPHANYFQRGDDWERPASFEFFDPHDGRVLAQDVGIRIHGGMSRALPNKSIRLYARSEYGEPRFEYPFFSHPDSHPKFGKTYPENPAAHDPPSYNRLILRASGQDFYWRTTMFRDAMIQGLVTHLDFDTQAYRPTILFINGEYWGIINIRERYDRHYFLRTYGIDPDQLDYLFGNQEVTEGSSSHYASYRSYLRQYDITESHHYEHISTLLDINNFIDYNITNIYVNNRDWPGNNREYIREQTEFNPDAPAGRDGRWRYLLIDTDFGFGRQAGDAKKDVEFDLLAMATKPGGFAWPNPSWSTEELRLLLKNPEFRREFINRFAGYLNTVFSPDHVKQHISHYEDIIAPVMDEHIQRWGHPLRMSAWNSHIRVMRDFAERRPYFMRKHMIDYFEELGDTVQVTLDIDGYRDGGHIRVNDIAITPQTIGVPADPWPWHGVYFAKIPLSFEAVPNEGYQFAGWAEYPGRLHPGLTLTPEENITLTAIFEPTLTGDDDEDAPDIPANYRLGQNYPNPFNNRTNIPYDLPESGQVIISVYSIDGRLVSRFEKGIKQAGSHTLAIAMDGWASGVYITRLQITSESGRNEFQGSRRMTLIK